MSGPLPFALPASFFANASNAALVGANVVSVPGAPSRLTISLLSLANCPAAAREVQLGVACAVARIEISCGGSAAWSSEPQAAIKLMMLEAKMYFANFTNGLANS